MLVVLLLGFSATGATGALAATGDLASAIGDVTSANERVADLDRAIAALQAEADRLQVKLDTASTGIQDASRQAGLIGLRVASLDSTATVLPAEDRTALAPTLQASRQALDEAEQRFAELMADAGDDSAVGKLAELRSQIESLTIQRDLAMLEAGALSTTNVLPPQNGGGHIQFDQWAHLFLQKIGAPACSDNLVVMVAWQAAEGTKAAWNPLATTLTAPGSTSFNSAGVQNYPSLDAGLQASVDTLERGYINHGYGWILYDLALCADPMTTATAINQSHWCFGCAHGEYVVGIIPDVEARYDWYAAR